MTFPDRVTLKGMRFHTRIGVLPHEAEIAQPVEIDVTAEVEAGAERMLVNYAVVYEAVSVVMQTPHIDYLETIANRISDSVLAIPHVAAVHVTVRKPHVPLPGPLAYAEVAIIRRAE